MVFDGDDDDADSVMKLPRNASDQDRAQGRMECWMHAATTQECW